jgi:hypothetical protein
MGTYFFQDTVATTGRRVLVLLLRASLVKVVVSTSKAVRVLPAVYPDMS